jgi:hypothetical protein
MQPIAARNFHLHQSEEFDWQNKLREKSKQYEKKLEMCKSKYSQPKRKFSDDMLKPKLKWIKLKYESVKRSKKRYALEYEQMKEQMGLQSPPSSDGSLSDD